MAGDIFISQGITLNFQVVNIFVSPQSHQGVLLSGVLTQGHACPPHHLPQGGPRTERESEIPDPADRSSKTSDSEMLNLFLIVFVFCKTDLEGTC